jgi:hypothetical protein
LTIGVDQYRYRVGVLSLNAANPADKAAVGDVFTDVTDAGKVGGRNNISPHIVA